MGNCHLGIKSIEMSNTKAIHIAKSHKPTRKPKLVKECACPNMDISEHAAPPEPG